MIKIKTGLPLVLIIFLAALAIPRVVVHDLKLIPLDSFWYTVLAVGPLVVWLAVAVLWKTTRPIYDFLVLGLVFGLLLAVAHQISWDASWGSSHPHIGGIFAGKLSPDVESVLLRSAAFVSSLATGLVFGAAFSLVATVATKIRNRT